MFTKKLTSSFLFHQKNGPNWKLLLKNILCSPTTQSTWKVTIFFFFILFFFYTFFFLNFFFYILFFTLFRWLFLQWKGRQYIDLGCFPRKRNRSTNHCRPRNLWKRLERWSLPSMVKFMVKKKKKYIKIYTFFFTHFFISHKN